MPTPEFIDRPFLDPQPSEIYNFVIRWEMEPILPPQPAPIAPLPTNGATGLTSPTPTNRTTKPSTSQHIIMRGGRNDGWIYRREPSMTRVGRTRLATALNGALYWEYYEATGTHEDGHEVWRFTAREKIEDSEPIVQSWEAEKED